MASELIRCLKWNMAEGGAQLYVVPSPQTLGFPISNFISVHTRCLQCYWFSCFLVRALCLDFHCRAIPRSSSALRRKTGAWCSPSPLSGPLASSLSCFTPTPAESLALVVTSFKKSPLHGSQSCFPFIIWHST